MDRRAYQTFFSQFRERFHDTGAIAPSSGALAHAITTPLRTASGTGVRVLEVGAGTGVFTRAIVAELTAGDRLDVFEINPAFQPFLQHAVCAAHPGVHCQLHVVDINREQPAAGSYDFVISGLPLNNFAPGEVSALLDMLYHALRPGGVLSYFEYIALRGFKQAVIAQGEERARLRAVGGVVEAFLAEHETRAVPVMWNLPPAWARHVRKAA